MLHGTTLINGRSRRLSHPVTGMGRAARRRRLGDGPLPPECTLPCDPAGSHPFPPRLRRTPRQILLVIAFDVLYFTTDPAVVKGSARFRSQFFHIFRSKAALDAGTGLLYNKLIYTKT